MQTADPIRVGCICLDQPAKWERIIWARIVPFLILINIALNPFPHITSIREFSYYSAAALLIFYFYKYRDWSALKTPLTLPVALFTAWAFVGLPWALAVGASIHDILFHLIKYIVLFLLLTIFFNSRAKINLLFWTIIVSVVISGFHDMYFFYVVGKNSFLTRMCIDHHQLPVGPMGFMALFAIALVVYLFRISKELCYKCALIACFGGLSLILFATQMRSIMIALPFVIVALFGDNKKLLFAMILIVISCLFLFSTQLRSFKNDISETDRLSINYMSLLMIKEHPLTGVGFSMETPGNNKLIDHKKLLAQVPMKFKYKAVEYTSPHNMWLGLAVRLGLVGLSLFVLIVIVAGRMCFTVIKQHKNLELRLTGQLCLGLLALFSIYGLFNEVFMHLLETLFCVLFAIINWSFCEAQKYNNLETAKMTP